MASDNGENVPALNSPSEKQRSKLTLEEIKANLRKRAGGTATGSRPVINIDTPNKTIDSLKVPSKQTNVASHSRGGSENSENVKLTTPIKQNDSSRKAKTNKEQFEVDDLTTLREKYLELANLCEEILTYCHLLDKSRKDTVLESLNFRETVRELEKLLDSARQREMAHLAHVDQHREAITLFEKRYYSLKARAKSHIKECQDERDRLKAELETLSAKYKTTESELYTAQSLLHSQQIEMDRLRDQTRNLPSEKEITKMSLTLRKLEDENGRLATERQQLLAQLDEANGVKREENRGNTRGTGGGGGGGGFGGSGNEWKNRFKDQHLEYENTIEKLREEMKAKEIALREKSKEADEYREYVEFLVSQVNEDRETED